MINFVMVENEDAATERIVQMLRTFFAAQGDRPELTINCFPDAIQFLTNYKPTYDIVFMDIDMPELNGMDAARKLREQDENVVIIFVTNMAQYAVEGYAVAALDFIVKPVRYKHLEQVLERALKVVEARRWDQRFTVKQGDKVMTIRVSDVQYIEVVNHTLHFHRNGETFTRSGSLKELERQLDAFGCFAKCNSCYLVNLNYVTAVEGFFATVGGARLQISHPRKKEFMLALAGFLGSGG